MEILRFNNQQQSLLKACQYLSRKFNLEADLYISGGSSFEVFKQLNKVLSNSQKNLNNLYQVDERYGPPGHKDSNWLLMNSIDLTSYKSANPVLTKGLNRTQTTKRYDQLVTRSLQSKNFKIAILGIGEDQHIAGIKPMTKTVFGQIFTGKFFTDYIWQDYQRLTLTPEALKRFDEVLVYAVGPAKAEAIGSLDRDIAIHESPMQILRQIPKSTVYYTAEGQ